jgi:hypothetical protein
MEQHKPAHRRCQLRPQHRFPRLEVDEERVSGEQLSFLGEAAVLGTYRVNHQFTIRGGYQLLYVEGVATAMSNFNAINDTVIPSSENALPVGQFEPVLSRVLDRSRVDVVSHLCM